MADKKISQLAAATLPLAGTEVVPIVQGGSTVRVPTDDMTVKNLRSNATNGIVQVVGPGAGTTRVMTVPNANFTAARTDAAQSFTGVQTFSSGFITGSGALPTLSGTGSPQGVLINDTLIVSGQAAIPNPYTQNIQIDIVWNDFSGNNVVGLVDLAVVTRQWANTSGVAAGVVFATPSGGGSTFATFNTTAVTLSQCTISATSGGNFTLRITINPTSNADRFGYLLTVPSMNGGTGVSVASVAVSLV
jgi:hypothetical protein